MKRSDHNKGVAALNSDHFRQVSPYRSILSKCPWVLGIHQPKNKGGCLHGEAIGTYNHVHAYHRIKNRVGSYLGHYSI